ncbi:MAG: aldehyde dehydrogenase family protein [Planctomycetota bacterium]|nr:MAG: aldehyde dehydrogenase family protein [Planctomycetota bacterium]
MDRDLAALQEVRDRLRAARDARLRMETASQEDADRWAKAVAEAGRKAAVQLARLANEETGMGHVTGKTLKNIFATEFTWEKIKALKTAGILHRDEARGVVELAHPAGVVAAVIPTTNPTSTALFKIIIALKARCPIVVSPHPGARRCIAESCRISAEAARAAGAPEGAVGWLENPTLEATQHLMSHRWTSLVLATGGPGLVKAAYSSGKPAIGVGAGNTPSYVHSSADVRAAVRAITLGQVFDNGTICSSEQSVVVERAQAREVLDEFRRRGAHVCTPEEVKALEPVVNKRGHMNPKIVGRFPRVIAEMAGFRVPENTTVLICPYEKVGEDAPLSIEKLCPLLTFYQVDGFEQAVERCREVLFFGGLGHSAAIHARDPRAVEEFGLRMPACRINVNSPSTQGSIGYTTNLDPSMTLGCGTPGGNIFSDNIGPLHLINVKRIAYVNEAMLAEDERLEHELRREFGESGLPWGGGPPHPGPRYTPSAAAFRGRSERQPAPVASGARFGASPLTPADIEAIISRHAR